MSRSSLGKAVSSLAAALLVAQPALSFQSPLSEESVREAYFLGQRNDQTTLAFFNPYVRTPYIRTSDRPQTGPVVSEVELYTPFVQLVELSSRRNNYSAQQASLDYHRGTDTVFVRVRIEFTPTYGNPQYLAGVYSNSVRPAPPAQRADFSQDFRISFMQSDRRIEPLSVQFHLTNTPTGGHFPFDPDGVGAWVHTGYHGNFSNFGGNVSNVASNYGNGRGSVASGWLVWLEFDANDISSSDDVQLDIFGPNDLHLAAKYDLSKLR
jgi:hypothetical protein